jgi:hypothetical protein
MPRKSRLLRILLTVAGVLAFVGYFAFSTFLFSPTEGDYEPDVSTLVPRNVDFFVAKADLSDDFDPFPHPAFERALLASPAWLAFERSEDYAAVFGGQDPLRLLSELEAELQQVKGVAPLKVFGGRDLALAGWIRGPQLEQGDWALYGRVNWLGKLGASLLRHPGLLGLDARGLSVAVEDDHVALSGPELPREIYLTRVRDVVVVGTSRELVLAARDLEARAGQDSLGQGAAYDEHIQASRARGPERDELEAFLDWRSWSEGALLSGRWPDPESPFHTTQLLSRFFQLGAIKDVAGVVGFDRGIRARVHATLSSEMVGPTAARLYRQRGADTSEILSQAAALAPADTGLFAYLHAGIGDLLREYLDTAEPALRANVDEFVRSTGKYDGAEALVAELDALFRGRLALIVRPNDYPVDEANDPPNDGAPTFAMALVLWTDGSERARATIEELHDIVVTKQQALGIQGPDPDKGGVFKFKVQSGHDTWEFWSPLVPGTGHLAVVVDGPRYILSNNFRMLGDLIATFYGRTPGRGSLSRQVAFQGLADEGLDNANALVWVAPGSLAETARAMSDRAASDAVLGNVDMARERLREEALVLRQEFGGRRVQELSVDERARLDELVDARMGDLQTRLIAEQVPALRDTYVRRVGYAEAVQSMLMMVAFDPKWMEVSLGAIVPLETP